LHRIFFFLVKNIIKKDLMLVQPNITVMGYQAFPFSLQKAFEK